MSKWHFLLTMVFAPMIALADGDHDHESDPHEENEKGIVEASEAKGIRISPEAHKNFGIRTLGFTSGAIVLPKSAIFFGLQEKNLYRLRDGFYKRIDFQTITKTKNEFTISSTDLKSGDQIVIEGLGFLRIAEIAAFGGVAHGHSH
ncbi:MAG TPA: hypothetical protein VM432_07185 [Bdellovibrionales bacterium]|nr:hypothetical protein [Bdellovibrionales bacterium]